MAGANNLFIESVHVERAQRQAAKNLKGDGEAEDYTLTDRGHRRLSLKLQGGTVRWLARTKDYTRVIGYAFPTSHEWRLTAPKEARELCGHVQALLNDDPKKVEPYLTGRHAGKNHQEALDAIRPDVETWTFGECVDQVIKGRTSPGAKAPLKPNGVKDLRGAFNRPECEELKATPACYVTKRQIEDLRDKVAETYGISVGKKVVTYTRSVLDWCLRYQSGKSGLSDRDVWWRMLHDPYHIEPRQRTPEIADIVASLLLAEEHLSKPLPGRIVDKPGVGAGVLAGLWWLVLTCQRGGAGMGLRSYNLVADENRAGWWIATWDEGDMKAGRAQMLPIPERAAKHLQRLRDLNRYKGNEDWAFPSERDPEVHATASGVYRILYRLAGRDALEVKKPKGWEPKLRVDGTPRKRRERGERRNLMEEFGIAWWSMHDARRSLTDFLTRKEMPGVASAILAHELDTKKAPKATASEREREDFLKLHTARITRMAYGSKAQFLGLKSEALSLWTDALLDEYERQKNACVNATLSLASKPPPGIEE
jgi:hypothetical protein